MFSPYPNRKDRHSALASLSSTGLLGWSITEGTFNASRFYEGMRNIVLPYLQPYPYPRSVVVMDGAAIHKSSEVHDMIASVGAVSVILPPYSPEFNPIEKVFSYVKM